MAFDTNRDTVVSRAGAPDIDEGLRQYMLKVYNYMTVGLLITALVSYLLATTPLAFVFFSQETGQPNALGWVAIVAPLALVFMLGSAVSSGNAAKAFTLFVVYSGLMGVSMTSIFWVYTGVSVLRVFLIAAGMFLGMSLYGYTTKRDMTSVGSFLYMGVWGLLLASIVNIFVRSSSLDWTISAAGVAIFVGLTAWDTFKIREMYNEGDTENTIAGKAIFGALSLYLDFINLFIYLLRFFGDRRD